MRSRLPPVVVLALAGAACTPPLADSDLRCRSSSECATGFTCSTAGVCEAHRDAGGTPLADGGPVDGGARDAAVDAGVVDAAVPDAGVPVDAAGDGGRSDGGALDGGPIDGGCVDEDGDGYGDGCDAGGDCDDGDRARNAGLVEVCDAVDNDCNGIADDGELTCPCQVRWPPDAGLEPYLFCHDDDLRWRTAQERCASLGAYHLLVFRDEVQEGWFLSELAIGPFLPEPYWLGFSDLEEEGAFVWDDGTPLTDGGYQRWTEFDPTRSTEENCGWRVTNGWQDINCAQNRTLVCQGAPELRDPDAPCVDEDEDGRGPGCALGPDCDDDEGDAWRWWPAYPNADGDGLSTHTKEWVCSGDELPSGYLYPRSPSADCDDSASSSLTTCDTCRVRVRDGRKYWFCQEPVAFDVATTRCTDLGGRLVIADDEAEDEWVQRRATEIALQNQNDWWIGLQESGGELRWLDGQLADPVSWQHYRFDFNNGQECVRMTRTGWHDEDCDTAFFYVCEET